MAEDYTQDKDFLAAPSAEQHAFLMSTDPDYAKASTSEQQAYLQHVGGSRRDTTSETLGLVSQDRRAALPPELRPDKAHEVREGSEGSGGFTVPGGNVPLRAGLSEAGSLAGAAGFLQGPGWRGGMPEASLVPKGLQSPVHYEPARSVRLPWYLGGGRIMRNVPRAPDYPAPIGPELNPPGLTSEIPLRMPRPKLSAKPPAPMPVGTPTNLPSSFEGELPPANSSAPAPQVRFVNQFEKPQTEEPAVDLAGQAPIRTGSEGRPATWTNERVVQLMKTGNRDAIAQGVRRGLELPENVRYVAGDADYTPAVLNPRDVTRFTPEGQPIRQSAQPSPPNQPSAYPSPREVIRFREEAPPVEPPAETQPAESAPPVAAPKLRAPRAPSQPSVSVRYPNDVIAQAHAEMKSALDLSDLLGRPGRYHADLNEPGTMTSAPARLNDEAWTGIPAQKGNIAGQFPWFNDPEISASKLKSALEKGKGADYERIVGKIADGIMKERETASGIVAEEAPNIRELAGRVRGIDPELAQHLDDLMQGKTTLAADALREYVREQITDAEQAAQFSAAIDDAAEEARQAGASEPNAPSGESRGEGREAKTAAPTPKLGRPRLGSSSPGIPE